MGAPLTRTMACLVRVGTDIDQQPVFVDLSRLDGVLAVRGDRTVARDVVDNLVEVARSLPNTPVFRGPSAQRDADAGYRARHLVAAAAAWVVVMAGVPAVREAAELAALCGPGGAGWTGLVCGDVDAAVHWRWHTAADGTVEIPTLGLELTAATSPAG